MRSGARGSSANSKQADQLLMCTRHVSAGYDDLGVLGTGSTCMAGNISTVCGTCFRGMGKACISICGKKLSCECKLDGTCC